MHRKAENPRFEISFSIVAPTGGIKLRYACTTTKHKLYRLTSEVEEWHSSTVRPVDVGDYTEFESLALKLVGRPSQSVLVAVTSMFNDQLSDLLDQLVLLNTKVVVVGDFNVPGDIIGAQLDCHVVDVFDQYSLRQHVNTSTNGNILDLILSQEDEMSGRLVSDVTAAS